MRKQNNINNRRSRVAEACSTCKRRKERCDGARPCGRCIQRGAESTCEFRGRANEPSGFSDNTITLGPATLAGNKAIEAPREDVRSNAFDEQTRLPQTLTGSPSPSIAYLPCLIQDAEGKHMFVGDSANLSFVQDIRRLVEMAIGPCPFTEDPLRYRMVQSSPFKAPSWLHAQPPSRLDLSRATYLIKTALQATCVILDLFDEEDLLKHLPYWLQGQHDEKGVISAIYYLLLAIGEQVAPDGDDELARSYFDYGQYLTSLNVMENPSIPTIQTYSIITMYMLGDARRNAAFMYLGIAVRAAYALGIHRSDVSALFTPCETRTRERLWKVIRTLDLFMSASLGRPPSTFETRDTEAPTNYSTSVDLNAIFEKILTEIYTKRMISTDVVQNISSHHRRWTARLQQGLAEDRVRPEDFLEDENRPNFGLIQMKAAYYWSIILLTRPFFMEFISERMYDALPGSEKAQNSTKSRRNKLLTRACIDSAIRITDLFKVLLRFPNVPRRLPFALNTTHVAALILGVSHFADLHKVFPIEPSFRTAREIMAVFPHDSLARRFSNILEHLGDACKTYLQLRAKQDMDRNAHLLGGIFGQINSHVSGNSTGNSSPSVSSKPAAEVSFTDETPSERVYQSKPPDIGNSGFNSDTVLTNLAHRSHNNLGVEAEATNVGWLMQYPRSQSTDTDSFQSPSLASASIGMVDALPNENLNTLMSPQTLWFKPYTEDGPFYAPVDTHVLDLSFSEAL